MLAIPGLNEESAGVAPVEAGDLDVLEVGGVGGGFETGAGFEVKVDMTPQLEGSGEVKAGSEGDPGGRRRRRRGCGAAGRGGAGGGG
ncbi:MAG: hypothetical protein LAT79_01750 [Kiritimatiellae bacterium]|nr:hypothetical protein [Kiritimatiellia bacterium]